MCNYLFLRIRRTFSRRRSLAGNNIPYNIETQRCFPDFRKRGINISNKTAFLQTQITFDSNAAIMKTLKNII